ncbi:helix-turn-helix domain-containing protein [Gynuella sunshinyii]|uniref:AraC-type DNA-binding domain-containing protein n=1 Tax=Gynuella sunshinyii YC6258 TaxID=1445510 RepID=A0A0C5VQ06_9GAMM|nr:AraC family transcriptional regulator [Gynuella sunshinyii]AJQ92354.1 araC-type DNA-binding domain-containing protein [Gynuella sunshinyii YC6258]
MPAIPLPFVIALLLLLLTAVISYRQEANLKPKVIFLLSCTCLVVITGLRWIQTIAAIHWLQPIAAACIPPATWYCFALMQQTRLSLWHLSGPLLTLLLLLFRSFWHVPLDILLFGLYTGYGFAVLRILFRNELTLQRVRFSDLDHVNKAAGFAGTLLVFSALIDGLIALDLVGSGGRHTMVILTTAQLLLLPLLSIAVITSSHAVVIDSGEDLAEPGQSKEPDSQENQNIATLIDHLIRQQQLFLDPDLTLNRLARKAGIPARQISAAMNAVHGRNISQLINEYRIEWAKRLLTTTQDPITQIYLASGFQTKSNFNREFSRITNTTPSDYRRSVST